ncbi:MAG TPA: hypothetical protein VN633_11830 [Bryobacteraceae bacterium]|nr:hypothetical protein [Bryobacteraceae bacterium]
MSRFRKLSFYFFLIGILLKALPGQAQSLSTIRDTVNNADGSKFNGIAIVSWQGFTAGTGATIAPNSTSVIITNGYLSVVLVPTTNASSGAYYTVNYESNSGIVLWTEYWNVPPSWTALTLIQVRISAPPNSGGSGGSGSGGVTLPINENDVTNLLSDLAARPAKSSLYSNSHAAVIDASGNLTAASGNTTDCVHVDGTSGACSVPNTVTINATFVDADTPAGNEDGTNLTFVLAQTPSPVASLSLYRNGLELRQNIDYTLSGNTISFARIAAPQSGDILQAFYRVTGSATLVTFTDAETPGGLMNGTNTTFTLSAAPTPSTSLQLFRNGSLLRQGTDYTLSANMITFSAAATPKAGDGLIASYRH